MSFSRRKKKFSAVKIVLLAVIVLLVLNAGDIGRFFFPIPYRQIIFSEAAGVGIDGYLLAAVIKTESNYNPRAVSVKGARGLMQVMPETGRQVAGDIGIRNYSPDLLFNPEINIKIGAAYISDLRREYGGNTVEALAAYNAGGGNVKKWIDQGIWDGDRARVDQIPYPETRQFIRKILFYDQAYKYLYDKPENKK